MRFVTGMIGAKNGLRVPLRVSSSFEYSESASRPTEILNRRRNLFRRWRVSERSGRSDIEIRHCFRLRKAFVWRHEQRHLIRLAGGAMELFLISGTCEWKLLRSLWLNSIDNALMCIRPFEFLNALMAQCTSVYFKNKKIFVVCWYL